MRPRLSRLVFLAALAGAQAFPAGARAQSTAAVNMPATWSTDPSCSASALRVTFGGNALAIERNGHLIFRGAASLAISDDEIAVRLGSNPDRNVIRFNRAGEAIRLASASIPLPRVPPLYPCNAPSDEASGTVILPSSATLPATSR